MESTTLTKPDLAKPRKAPLRTLPQGRSKRMVRSPQEVVSRSGQLRRSQPEGRVVVEFGSERGQESLNAFSNDRSGVELSLPKLFLIIGYVVGALLLAISALDLAVAIPFERASVLFDVGLLFSSMVLLYLSWDARDACRSAWPRKST